MTVDPDLFDSCDTLVEALRLMATLDHGGRGVLQVAAGATKGSLTFANGVIVDARVNGQQLDYRPAIDHLISLGDSVFFFTEDEGLTQEPEPFHLKALQLLDELCAENNCSAPAQEPGAEGATAADVSVGESVKTAELPELSAAPPEPCTSEESNSESAESLPVSSLADEASPESTSAEGEKSAAPSVLDDQCFEDESAAELLSVLGHLTGTASEEPSKVLSALDESAAQSTATSDFSIPEEIDTDGKTADADRVLQLSQPEMAGVVQGASLLASEGESTGSQRPIGEAFKISQSSTPKPVSDPRRTYQSIKKPSISTKVTGNVSKSSGELPAVPPTNAPLPDLSTWTTKEGMEAIAIGAHSSVDLSTPSTFDNFHSFDDTIDGSQSDLVIVNITEGIKVLPGGSDWQQAVGLDDDDWDSDEDFTPKANMQAAETAPEESSLSEQQRMLLKQVELLADKELFNEQSADMLSQDAAMNAQEIQAQVSQAKLVSDPKAFSEISEELQKPQEELLLSEEQMKLAATAEVDDRSIHDTESALADASTLDSQQKMLLEMVTDLADAESFAETIDELRVPDELVIMQEERWSLEQTAQALSPEQQKTDFAKFDGRLAADAEKVELQEFKEYADLNNIPTPVVDDVLQAEVLPSDSDPLIAHAKAVEIRERDQGGLIGRIKNAIDRRKIAIYDGPMPSGGPQIGHLIGPTILCMLCVALFTIPAMVRSSVSRADAPQLAREQMRLVVADELNDSIPYAQHDVEQQNELKDAGMINKYAPETGGPGSAGASDSLMAARAMLANGHEAAAMKEYESYLTVNPDSVPARIELINLYLKQGKKSQAKWHCLRGMKQKCAGSELEQFWSLWRQCMLG
jgi:hypothetical protein